MDKKSVKTTSKRTAINKKNQSLPSETTQVFEEKQIIEKSLDNVLDQIVEDNVSPQHPPPKSHLYKSKSAPLKVTKTSGRDDGKKGKSKSVSDHVVSRSRRAGIVFPVSRIDKMLREQRLTKRVSGEAPVYLAAVIEYLVYEVLELAILLCNQNNKQRITPQHINVSISNDVELHDLFKNVTIISGGVIPNILPQLKMKTKKYNAQTEKSAFQSDENDS